MLKPRLLLVAPLAASVLLAAGCAAGDDTSTAAPAPAPPVAPSSSVPSSPSLPSASEDSGVSSAPASPTAPPTPLSTPAFDGTVVTVSLADGEVETESKRVKVDQGSEVRLIMTSDEDNEIHIHGVDEYVDLTAGDTVTHDFTAEAPGTYEVELHEGDRQLLFNLQVQ